MKIKTIKSTPTFERDYKSLKKKHYNMDKLEKAIVHLSNRDTEILRRKYKDHALKGHLNGLRELHIEGDWLLMYQIKNDILELLLIATGSHDHIFR
ncbi:type II toxin-antitoxin system YafQ family toxin [Enterococcus sp. 669A]|uniref:Type II toxin-antitoxin system YafQ family toxin n=1 Tax=Candidatus Enterococcus moelleringii TaxID=2815325 RepID=A0ABS3LBA1_9ENTE|nr:type II toxin-antitoxin system YafQ family toxin [Enterococcus sp. 669A]MBO1306920.1 type II toxin-antitoxin system YafQ family toxin [Enterococcus sp. 669A]